MLRDSPQEKENTTYNARFEGRLNLLGKKACSKFFSVSVRKDARKGKCIPIPVYILRKEWMPLDLLPAVCAQAF